MRVYAYEYIYMCVCVCVCFKLFTFFAHWTNKYIYIYILGAEAKSGTFPFNEIRLYYKTRLISF